ncbi:hypothetical protein CALVIDRAFT_595205 [Calocera viscosa TUFC12733]|uniref:VOC domain-containing protein n=1 Tax=Calocera viscosa (strain TUFC12733) TaxID=1330018 RepID=A0A167QYM3_CALVF|nr:hypothetical protein CALVIDRAFT_595205 [Calocera viscosa TUFC12733]
MPSNAPPFSGVHHFKLACSSLTRSLEFYTSIIGAARVPAYDHYDASGRLYAHILRLAPTAAHPETHKIPVTTEPILIELRLAPESAKALGEKHVDLLTLSAPSEAAVDQWAKWFTSQGVDNSGKLRGLIGHLVVCEDPDGLRFRIYSTEMPEGGMDPSLVSVDEKWLA